MDKSSRFWKAAIYLLLIPITYAIATKYLDADTIRNNRGLYLFLSCLPSIFLFISDMNTVSADEGQRKTAQNTGSIPKEYLKKTPGQGDFILGERNGKYVCTSIHDTDSHYSIIGTSGTGKTSCYLINNILLNDNIGMFILDVKDSELYHKTTKIGDENVERFDPTDCTWDAWGFDPFYRIESEGYSDYVLLESLQLIANSLVAIPADAKDPFWSKNARNLFMGLSLKFYKDGCHDLISIIDRILEQPIEDSITYVLDTAQSADAEFKYMIMFSDMKPETLYGIFAELSSNLTTFANHPGVRHCFGSAKKKISPLDLEEGKKIYICVNETELQTMNNIVKVILDVTLYALQKRMDYAAATEKSLKPILFVVDELPQVVSSGPLPQLIQALRVLRAFKVRMVLCYQTLESLQPAYTQTQCIDIASNTNFLIALNAGNSVSTQKLLCDLVGTYKEKKRSFSGKNHQKTTINFQDENILYPSDINTLPCENKALILHPSGYMVIKKSPYYKDRFLKKEAAEIEQYNRNIQELQKIETEMKKNGLLETKSQLRKWSDLKKKENKNKKGEIDYEFRL